MKHKKNKINKRYASQVLTVVVLITETRWDVFLDCDNKQVHFQVEEPLGIMVDDTALNSVRLYCRAPTSQATEGSVTSGYCWGAWGGEHSTPSLPASPHLTCLCLTFLQRCHYHLLVCSDNSFSSL